MKTMAAVLFFVLLFVAVPARSAPITGAQIQTWTYDADTKIVTVRVVNTSPQPITAYVLFVKAGGSEWRTLQDFLSARAFHEKLRGFGLSEEQIAQVQFGPEAIPVGGYYDQQVSVAGLGFKDFFAAIEAVTFENNSMEAVNSTASTWITDSRKSAANAIEKANTIILASSDHDTAAKEIDKAIAVDEATPHTSYDLSTAGLSTIAYDLRNTGKRISLKDFAASKEKERQIWLSGAKLKIAGGAQ
jgi:hypothetical protein